MGQVLSKHRCAATTVGTRCVLGSSVSGRCIKWEGEDTSLGTKKNVFFSFLSFFLAEKEEK